MPSFKFVCEHRRPWDETVSHKNTMEFDDENLYSVISEFQDFLRGCGFQFNGRLEIVDDTESTGCGDDCSSCTCSSDEPDVGAEVMNWTIRQMNAPRDDYANQG